MLAFHNMADALACPERSKNRRHRVVARLNFGETPFDVLNDFLINLNNINKDYLDGLPKWSGTFKQKRLVEYIFLITQQLKLDPSVGYHAIELLQRFMVKHVADTLAKIPNQSVAINESKRYGDLIFNNLKDTFPLILFSCVQLANKLFLHCHMIDTSTAVQFLHSFGLSVSKQTLLESELMVFKGVEYRLNVLNSLTYVEVILEVLGHNEPSVPVEHLYRLCHYVLQFVTLEQTAIYDSLLRSVCQCVSPSMEQRENFVTVTEDRMLRGVCVIAVATYILCFKRWKQVVGELSHITGIARRNITEFALVIVAHITGTSSSAV
ncbi:cyclin N-terminal domain-containing protein 1 [Poecilia reticulata]|uniref:Cyclin N-terminal domain containing 1 n=1 Tax=Poecilia reticulata TaxID=8081 RepID=A0A3P9P1X1_POERE|nr:PREDICTED: cyclin N-terminal domain-containing protein 1 [Poecilia reticulata]